MHTDLVERPCAWRTPYAANGLLTWCSMPIEGASSPANRCITCAGTCRYCSRWAVPERAGTMRWPSVLGHVENFSSITDTPGRPGMRLDRLSPAGLRWSTTVGGFTPRLTTFHQWSLK